VPKAIAPDGGKPRRRRGAAVAAEETAKRGLAMRILLHSPKDMVAGAVAFAAAGAIIANALFMQAGRHPSPMFGGSVGAPMTMSAPAGPLPRPRPVEADAKAPDSRPAEARSTEVTGTSTAGPAAARPPTPNPQSSRGDQVGELITTSRRVAAVQRVLTEYGYGQLKATGMVGSDTQAAIQKFERERKIPVTGQVSERLVRELAAMTGRPIE
jgi:Putative peptidoglycan binding domain